MLRKMWSAFSRRGAGSVYAALVPVVPGVPDGAADFLDDLWDVAPIRVSLAATLGALAVIVSPPVLLGRLTLFPRLSAEEQERLLVRLMEARGYPLRLLFYGVKSMALLAVLRDPHCRGELGLDGGA